MRIVQQCLHQRRIVETLVKGFSQRCQFIARHRWQWPGSHANRLHPQRLARFDRSVAALRRQPLGVAEQRAVQVRPAGQCQARQNRTAGGAGKCCPDGRLDPSCQRHHVRSGRVQLQR